MTYAANDISPSSGKPMEFFKFEGLLKNYLYCNQSKDEILAGETYTGAVITRSEIKLSSIINNQNPVSVTVPANSEIAEDYGGKFTPTQLRLTIYRAYRGDDLNSQFKQRYTGRATHFGYDNRLFVMNFQNTIATDLQSENRQIFYQSLCNHKVYDARCKADKVANTTTATIVAFSDQAVEVDDDGWPDDDLKVGWITNLRTGEERLIFKNLANVIDIGYPFLDIVVGDTVSLVRGCNNGTADCVLKFNNYPNYGGYLHIPTLNPFESET
jgi:hypothetical protein